jgi:amidophosphoribosyltransferase
MVSLKLNIIDKLVRDRRIIVVDDSIVRGTTTRSKMRALRRSGAREIHLRISCPPIRHPCFYGIDFATRDELIANGRTVEQIRDYLEVDSLAYLSLEGMISCTGIAPKDSCTACWSGHYKISVDDIQAKFEVERQQLRMFEDWRPSHT